MTAPEFIQIMPEEGCTGIGVRCRVGIILGWWLLELRLVGLKHLPKMTFFEKFILRYAKLVFFTILNLSMVYYAYRRSLCENSYVRKTLANLCLPTRLLSGCMVMTSGVSGGGGA